MARTVLTKTKAKGAYGSYGAGEADVTMTNADTENKNRFLCTNNDLVIAHNSGETEYTVTIESESDPTYNREGDISTYPLAAGDIAVFGPFKNPGWIDSAGYINLEASGSPVQFGVIGL